VERNSADRQYAENDYHHRTKHFRQDNFFAKMFGYWEWFERDIQKDENTQQIFPKKKVRSIQTAKSVFGIVENETITTTRVQVGLKALGRCNAKNRKYTKKHTLMDVSYSNKQYNMLNIHKLT